MCIRDRIETFCCSSRTVLWSDSTKRSYTNPWDRSVYSLDHGERPARHLNRGAPHRTPLKFQRRIQKETTPFKVLHAQTSPLSHLINSAVRTPSLRPVRSSDTRSRMQATTAYRKARLHRARQLYKNISMLFLFPVKVKDDTGVNATFDASCYG